MLPVFESCGLRGLSIGQHIEIGYVPPGEAPTHQQQLDWLPTRVEDLDEVGGRLTVAWPTDHERRLIAVATGGALAVSASTPSDAMYSAQVVVEDVSNTGVPLLLLKLDGAWQRIQRRSAVRLDVVVRPRAAARMIDEVRKQLRLELSNISAGGVQVRSRDELHHGDLVELEFELLGMVGELPVQARVRRVERQDRPASVIWQAGCEFEGVPRRVIDRIVQFIFAQQRAVARVRRSAP
jgi:c-di-GMP-binding flagellar brake protein YcgR